MLSGKTLVCVALMVDEVEGALRGAERARSVGADVVEFRVDPMCAGGVGDVEVGLVERLCAESVLPCVLTCRPEWEGGAYAGDEAGRARLFGELLRGAAPPTYVDVEKVAWEDERGEVREAVSGALGEAGLILSAHDFDGRPAGLMRLLGEMRGHGEAAVHKVAFRARSVRDNVEVAEVLRERDRPMIALAMGEEGVLSRVCAGKFGGYLTFASLDEDGTETAPGQVGVERLLGMYRFREVGPRTRVYGVIGDPVSHSASPAVHNDAFGVARHEGVYVPMRVVGGWEGFKATVLELMGSAVMDFGGASVTSPHKEHLVRLAGEEAWALDAVSAACGAGNTLVVGGGGGARVMNTDAAAVVGPLVERFGGGDGRLAGVEVGVVGTGGAARAAAAGLALAGARVVVFGRDAGKAGRVAGEVRSGVVEVAGGGVGEVVGAGLGAVAASGARAFVHCTPVGMAGSGAEGEMAFDPGEIVGVGGEVGAGGGAGGEGERVLFETVYSPARTALLEAGERAGFGVVDGLEMFARQAAAQSEAWTGVGADVARMRRVAGDWLGV